MKAKKILSILALSSAAALYAATPGNVIEEVAWMIGLSLIHISEPTRPST